MSTTKTSFKAFVVLMLFSLCCACSHKPAQVVNRGQSFYGKNSNYNKDKYRNSTKKQTQGVALRNHQIEVGDNETIYTVSKKYQVPLRDLIKQNNLTAPYKLNPKDKLTIPAPTYHLVASGDTLYSIARTYKMSIGSLIEMNDLKTPYNLEVGKKIRIVKFSDNEDAAPVKIAAPEKQEAGSEKSVTDTTAGSHSPGFVEKILDKINHFSWPLRGEIISKFGPKSGGLYNDGINIKGVEGEAVKAAEDGVISYAGNELKGYGNLVIIKHSGGWITAYAHLSKILVKRGQKVTKLSKIGEVGSTGNVTSPQLYFGLRKGRDAVNPENYLSK